eukprot:4143390-Prymnesium_polylepis.1
MRVTPRADDNCACACRGRLVGSSDTRREAALASEAGLESESSSLPFVSKHPVRARDSGSQKVQHVFDGFKYN